MGLGRRISEIRRKQIVSHADPHLLDEEEVRDWARAVHPETRQKGFVYLTDDRFLIAWRESNDEAAVVDLDEVRSWGVRTDDDGAPMLCVEGRNDALVVEFRTGTRAMTDGARQFLTNFARLAPKSAGRPNLDGAGDFKTEVEMAATGAKLSPGALAKRITVTILGAAMLIAAPLITPIPGPWSILLAIAGLALLATEYDWAEDAQDWMRARYRKARDALRARREHT